MAEEVDLSALDLLTVPEVAKRLRVSQATVWRLVRDGDIESVLVSERARRIPPEAIIAYKERLLAEAAEKRAAKAAGTDAA